MGQLKYSNKVIEENRKFQQVVSVTGEFVKVTLKDPYSINLIEKPLKHKLKEFVIQHIINGNEYRLSHYDEQLMQFYFYQTYEGKK
ncbi:two-component system regulatory protein YycI [Anaerobacillus sp. HL2]|nr:two-component system regulatory protein YycI [Anaerobacillus sp. HL2]